MWIFGSSFFVSAVQDRDNKDTLRVRGRVVGDVVRFMKPIVAVTEQKAVGTDYAVCAMVPRHQFAEAAAYWAAHVSYDNFKSSVKENGRHDAYMDVWMAMKNLQDHINPLNRTKKKLERGILKITEPLPSVFR